MLPIRIASLICCGYTLESQWRGDSKEYPQHMFSWRTDKNYISVIIKYPTAISSVHVCIFLQLAQQLSGIQNYEAVLF